MKVAGIIVEYNPLHNGHLHHILKTRELSKCDILIAVTSGNFTQRGEPAIIDKFTRTKFALLNHVDLVVEIPYVLTVQNANIFALSAVSILNHLLVDEIYFGSESGSIEELTKLSDILDSDKYNELVKENMGEGYSFPTASDYAVRELTDTDLYSKPNNILGIQYISAVKKLKSNIILKTIERINSDYHDTKLNHSNIQSATAIRKLIVNNDDFSKYVPKDVFTELSNRKPVLFNQFTDILKYKLKSMTSNDLNQIFSMEEGIENWILKTKDFSSVDELIQNLLTRRYTNSKIKRSLTHILLNLRKDEVKSLTVPYIRVLGMNDTGRSHLNKIKKELTIPLVTKILKNKHPYLELDLRASKIYSLYSDKDVYKMEFEPVIYKHND
ncbi:MAG: nucleotidyltransferase [Candidatus Izemoplasma sp.]